MTDEKLYMVMDDTRNYPPEELPEVDPSLDAELRERCRKAIREMQGGEPRAQRQAVA